MMKKYGSAVLILSIIIGGYLIFFAGGQNKKETKEEQPKVLAEKSEISPTQTMTPTEPSKINPSISSAISGAPALSKEPGKPPPMIIDKTKKYTATLTTTAGAITIELFADKTPITVNNFVYLAKTNFYSNTIFHRVIKGFMIQGGDPKGNGTGGPDYKFDDEPFDGQYSRGTVAMANAGANTNGSQFFIMHQDYALPKNYVIFGKVTTGMETVDKIATAPVKPSAMGENSTPVDPVKVEKVEIVEE